MLSTPPFKCQRSLLIQRTSMPQSAAWPSYLALSWCARMCVCVRKRVCMCVPLFLISNVTTASGWGSVYCRPSSFSSTRRFWLSSTKSLQKQCMHGLAQIPPFRVMSPICHPFLLSHSLTHSLTHSLLHSLTHSRSHSLTHTHTHSLTHSLSLCVDFFLGSLVLHRHDL